MGLLASALALGDVALDAQQHRGVMLLVALQDGDVDLVGLLPVIAPDAQRLRETVLNEDVRDPCA